MKRRWLTILLLISVGLNVGLFASRILRKPAEGVDTGERTVDKTREATERLPKVVQRMARELGLEGAKRDAFVDIQRGFFEQTMAARGRMASLQLEIRREITSTEPNRDTLDVLLIELSEAHTDLERAFVNNLLDSRELLDAEQERLFMRFLRRMRHVRSDLERRFRERWQSELGGRQRRRPTHRRARPPAENVEPEVRPDNSSSSESTGPNPSR